MGPQVFTPAGGMNQDDSLITPGKETAGRSPFALGDYRYALNGKIGSTRHDNAGDFEIIRSTLEVTSYYANRQLFTNSEFDGTLSPWLQLDDGPGHTAWSYGTVGSYKFALLSVASGIAFTSQVLYQTGLTLQSTVKIKISKPIITVIALTGTINVVFLNGTTILEEHPFDPSDFASNFEREFNVPSGADGIGIRIQGTTIFNIFSFSWQVDFFKAFSYEPGSVPAGNERVIGKYEDDEFQQIIYAVWNSNGDHTIRAYKANENIIVELLRWSGLKFESDYFVKMAKLDNWICLTDRNNKPRLINEISTPNLFNALEEPNFREFHISLHKWAPTAPAVIRAFYNGFTNNWDKLKGKAFQFTYCYVYDGNLRSRYAPVSKAAVTSLSGQYYNSDNKTLTSIEVHIPGFFLDDPDVSVEYNYFGHGDQKFFKCCKYIELVFRESEIDAWKLWKRVPVTSATSVYHYFTNEFDSRVIAPTDIYQPFDSVPFKAGTVEAVDNRFVFGDVLEEYEPITDISFENVSVITGDFSTWIYSANLNLFTSLSTSESNLLKRTNSLANFNFKSRGRYKVAIIFHDHMGWRSLGYTSDNLLFDIPAQTQTHPIYGLAFKIPDTIKPPVWATSYQVVRTNCMNIDYFMHGHVNKFTPLLDSPNDMISAANLSESTKQKLNEYFANSNIVDGYAVASAIDAAEQSERGDNFIGRILTDSYLYTNLDKKLTEENLYRQDSQGEYKKWNPMRFIIGPEVRKSSSTTVIANSARIYIDINNWYNAAQKTGTSTTTTSSHKLSNLYYNFRQGDRVRFLASEVASPTLFSQVKAYDAEILEFTGNGIIIEKPDGILSLPNNTGIWFSLGKQIEVYTPKKINQQSSVEFEVGEWYPVLYPGSEERDFSKREWTFSANSAVTANTYGEFKVYQKTPFFVGDCSRVIKSTPYDLDTVSRTVSVSMNPDSEKTYDFWEKFNGFPSVLYLDFPEVRFKPTMARFGGKVVEESTLNQINRFRGLDFFIYPSEYGRIRDMINTGNAQVETTGSILLAIGERQTWSIYVNRTTLEDLSGRTLVSLSDKVLGSYNVLLGGHGTLNPESVSKHRGRVYWFNAIDGVWVRYGRNGLTEISDYKMRTWFKELSSLLIDKYLTDDVPVAISVFDAFSDELLTFIDHDSLPVTFRGYADYKGSVFSEDNTRWKTCHSYVAEMFGMINDTVISFKNGKVYRHEAGSDYLEFYGQKEDAYIQPVFNDAEMNMKSWQNMAIVATHGWSAEDIESEYRGSKTKQKSRILLSAFDEREDTFYADFKMNLNTPNVPVPIIDGEKMRSKALKVLLKLDPDVTDLSLLHYVVVSPIDSPKNPVNL